MTPTGEIRIPGLIKTEADALANTHPMPIVYRTQYIDFQASCLICGWRGTRRSLLQVAATDRYVHLRDTHPEEN